MTSAVFTGVALTEREEEDNAWTSPQRQKHCLGSNNDLHQWDEGVAFVITEGRPDIQYAVTKKRGFLSLSLSPPLHSLTIPSPRRFPSPTSKTPWAVHATIAVTKEPRPAVMQTMRLGMRWGTSPVGSCPLSP